MSTFNLALPRRLLAVALAAALALAALPAALRPPAAAHADAAAPVNCDVDANQLAVDAEEQAMLDLINGYRAQNGLGPVAVSPTLQRVALWKSTDMATYHYTNHDDSFRGWEQRFRDCGYNPVYGYMAENLAGGYGTAIQIFQQWESSPVHDHNLLDGDMTVAGIVRAKSNDAYGWYWTLELGSVADM